MRNETKGVYKNEARGRQLLLFTGMQYGTMSPTDIDGIIDVKGKGWIIYEVKYEKGEFTTGQRILLERMCKDLSATGKFVIAMVVDHKDLPETADIVVEDCLVRCYKINGQSWIVPAKPTTAKEATDYAVSRCIERKIA